MLPPFHQWEGTWKIMFLLKGNLRSGALLVGGRVPLSFFFLFFFRKGRPKGELPAVGDPEERFWEELRVNFCTYCTYHSRRVCVFWMVGRPSFVCGWDAWMDCRYHKASSFKANHCAHANFFSGSWDHSNDSSKDLIGRACQLAVSMLNFPARGLAHSPRGANLKKSQQGDEQILRSVLPQSSLCCRTRGGGGGGIFWQGDSLICHSVGGTHTQLTKIVPHIGL